MKNINQQSNLVLPGMGVVEDITNILLPHRRTIDTNMSIADQGLINLQSKLTSFVANDQPIQLMLPAFPCKSASKRKVLGELPDMAEELSLKFLDGICKAIREIHKPGANLTICSDGRVFSPIVRVPDKVVSSYTHELQHIIESLGLTSLQMFHLEDVFAGSEDNLRSQLLHEFATPIVDLKHLAKSDPSLMNTFLGITRFMFEEGLAWDEQNNIKRTNSQVQKDAKNRAWQVVQASQAWSSLTDKEQFPDAVRLSIHPQGQESSKFGITLLPTKDSFLTPWHGVAVIGPDKSLLARRVDAERLPAKIMHRNGRPSHFGLSKDV